MCRKIHITNFIFFYQKFITIAGLSVSRLLPIANFCLVLVYEFPFRQYCLALNRASHVPSIKTRRFRLYRRFHYSRWFQNIYIYHCYAYRCYSVYASSRFRPCCPTECGDWENVHVQIGIDMYDFDVLACILYDHRYSDITVYKFNNPTFYAVWLKIRYKNRQTFETMKCKSLKKVFQIKILGTE